VCAQEPGPTDTSPSALRHASTNVAWSTYARHERELNYFHMWCLRNILGITWRDKVTNEAVLARTGSKSMFRTLKAAVARSPSQNARWPPAKGRLIQRAERWFQRQRTTTAALQGCRDTKALDNWERLAEDRTKWHQQPREGGDRLDNDWIRGLAQKRGQTVSL
ncbi:hypothetical protein KUCAC02_007018, partial [Chaenocephalus aceratus]